jgi:hypothetical protein
VPDREKTDGSTIQRNSKESNQVEQEQDWSNLQVENDDVIYFDNNIPPSEFHTSPRRKKSMRPPRLPPPDRLRKQTRVSPPAVESEQTKAGNAEVIS